MWLNLEMYFYFRSILKKTNRISFNLYILLDNIFFIFRKIGWYPLRFQPALHIENVPLCDIASLGSICQSVEKKLNFLAETLLFWSSKSVSSFLSSWSCSSSVNQTLHSTPVEQQDGSHLSYSKNRVDECVVIFQLNTC